MDLNKLADALIPDKDLKPLEEYEKMYPPRELAKGAEVTRIAPSPTGFMHFGNLYVALANERLAHQSGGVFYLRIEDTDQKRKVEGAVEVVHKSLKYFGVNFDEGADKGGNYGPYYQRQRAKIYHAFAKDLIRRGLAYPCFCTEEDLEKRANIRRKTSCFPAITENSRNAVILRKRKFTKICGRKAVCDPPEIAGQRRDQAYVQRRNQGRNHRNGKRSGRGDFKIGRDSHLSFRACDRRSFHAYHAGDARGRMAFVFAHPYRTFQSARFSAAALRA